MDSYVKQFNKYYDETRMTVRKIAYRILKNVDDADDVTQEVFFKLFNYFKAFSIRLLENQKTCFIRRHSNRGSRYCRKGRQ